MKLKNLGRTLAMGGLAYLLSRSAIESKPSEIFSANTFSTTKQLVESSSEKYFDRSLKGKKLQFEIIQSLSKIADNISTNNGWFSIEAESACEEYSIYHLNKETYSLLVALDEKGSIGAIIYQGILSDDLRERAEIIDTRIQGFGLRRGIDSFKITRDNYTLDLLASDEIIANSQWLSLLKSVSCSITNMPSIRGLDENP